MSKRRRANPRLRRAWNKRPKYLPSFTNMKEYTNMHVTAGVRAEELMRGEAVVSHDTLLMLKELGDFHQGVDRWHKVNMPWLAGTDTMYFSGYRYVFFRNIHGMITRTCIFESKEKAYSTYRSGSCHFFLPYKQKETKYNDPVTGLKPHPNAPKFKKKAKEEEE